MCASHSIPKVAHQLRTYLTTKQEGSKCQIQITDTENDMTLKVQIFDS